MIPYSRQSIDEDDIKTVCKALRGEFLTGGAKVDEFEKALCKYTGSKYAVAVNSATSALHLAFICADLSNKDEFITTPLSFAATSATGLMVGSSPVFCDIKNDGNIDEKKIEDLITNKTKALVPVDFGGVPVEIDIMLKIAKKHSLMIIDDASHALGSTYGDGRKDGSQADISIFSFHAIKPITTLEGGALLTNNEHIYNKAKLLRSHNIKKIGLWDSTLEEFGYNYRLSDIACALGLSQLKKLDHFIAKREEIALFYNEKFTEHEHIQSLKNYTNPKIKSSRHLYPILLNKNFWNKKENIVRTLRKKGLGVQVHYKPLYHYDLFKAFLKNPLKKTETFYKAELSIPCHQGMSLNDADFVVKTLENTLKETLS